MQNRKGVQMSVRTTANQHVDSAYDYVDSALKSLNEIVVNKCWGYDENGIEKNKRLEAIHAKLIVIRRELSEEK